MNDYAKERERRRRGCCSVVQVGWLGCGCEFAEEQVEIDKKIDFISEQKLEPMV